MTDPLGRIWFPGNPWPGGHAIKEAELWGVLSGDGHEWATPGVTLHMRIVSADYYSESSDAEIEAMDIAEEALYAKSKSLDNWRSLSCWSNYHRCHIETASSIVLADETKRFSPASLDGLTLKKDPLPEIGTDWEYDELAFQCYILGHDSVADHTLNFQKTAEPATFKIDWKGRVANSYAGDDEFKYRFDARLQNIQFKGFQRPREMDLIPAQDTESGESEWFDRRTQRSDAEREAEARALASKYIDMPASALRFHKAEYMDWLLLT